MNSVSLYSYTCYSYGRGGIGVEGAKSWESWWDEEQEHLSFTGFRGRLIECILAMRFFLYQYGIIYHLNIVQSSNNLSISVRPKPFHEILIAVSNDVCVISSTYDLLFDLPGWCFCYQIYGLSWLVILAVIAVLKVISETPDLNCFD